MVWENSCNEEDREDVVAGNTAIRSQEPSLVFLDVQMPGLDGFDKQKQLPKSKLTLIILLTTHDQNALGAFEVHALDSLLKTIDSEGTAEAIAHVRRKLGLQTAESIETRLRSLIAEQAASTRPSSCVERFLIRTGSRMTFVFADEIDWIEAKGDYAGLHVGSKTSLLRETLNTLEERLDPKKFVRIHRSVIVHASRICEMRILPNRELRLRLTGGANLKVSRTYRERFDRWLSGARVNGSL